MQNIDVGFKIKRIREEKNLSQEQLATLLEISQSRLSKIENGRLKKIEMKLILKICKSTGMDINEFFENKETVDTEK